ncbi:MAG TPA: hypothetical protein VM141_09155 [Planctomycetota bacterium]|nr:hypothetical protein [Planctomycetota bacterium]
MADASNVEVKAESPEFDAGATGAWSESFIQRPKRRFSFPREAFFIACLLHTSPATAVPDIWYSAKRIEDAATASSFLDGAIGRPISRAEALRIVDSILVRAERERAELAENEATHIIELEMEL